MMNLVAILGLLLLPLAASAAPAAPPTAQTTVRQNVRTMGHLGAPILEVLPPGTTVMLHARTQDRSWVDVETPDHVKGWMYRPLLAADDQAVAALPAIGTDSLLDPQDPHSDAPPGGARPAGPSPTPQPTEDPLVAMNTAVFVELPAGPATDDAAVLSQRVPITLVVCADVNQNRGCDLGEGIRDVPVLVRDTTTAQVLATQPTGADGLFTLTVNVPAGDQLAVEAPTLAWSEPVLLQAGTTGDGTVKPPQLPPLIVPPPVALPWPHP